MNFVITSYSIHYTKLYDYPYAEACESPEYAYIITGEARVSGMTALNTVTNEIVDCAFAEELSFADSTMYSTHPWSIQRQIPQNDVIFDKGEHIIDEDIIINRNSQLIINEGAVLKLTAGVSIIVFGELRNNFV